MRFQRRTHVRARSVAICAIALLASCGTTPDRADLATEYFNIGTAYFELGDLERSATYLSRAIELDPTLGRASYNLARVRIDRAEYEEAIVLLEELLVADPTNSLVLETLGYSAYLAGDLDQAGRWYDRARDVNATDPELLQNRAVIHRELEEYGAAATLIERAIDLSGESPELLLELARTRRNAQDTSASIEAYESYLSATPEPAPDAAFELALLYQEAEFFADALDILNEIQANNSAESALRASASFESARILLLEADEPEDGIDAVQTAISLGFADMDEALSIADQLDAETRALYLAVIEGAGSRPDGENDEPPEPGEQSSGSGDSGSP